MMSMKTRRMITIVAGCVLAAGCGTGGAVSATASSAPAPGAARSASAASAATRCRKPAPLPAGAQVQAWRLGAIRFVSAQTGLALTAPRVACDVPLGNGQGTQVYLQAQPVRLATTSDGGRHWVTSGSVLPATPQSATVERVAAVDGTRIWVLTDTGRLLETRDAGATWAAQPVPAPVVAAASSDGWLWALSCPAVTGASCRPEVERMKLPAGTWTTSRPTSSTSLPQPQLAVISATAAVVVLPGSHPALASTGDGGAQWTVHAVPAGPGNICRQGGGSPLMAAAGPADWWLLCTGGAAAGSSTKALMRSADAGRTWTVAASELSLSAPASPGSLARQDAVAIAAASPEALWLATPNTVTQSTDGGATWSRALFNPQGALSQFDVESATDAWVLAPNAGLWHTTDGVTWRSVGGAAP